MFDLAANSANAQACAWYGPDGLAPDALACDWGVLSGVLWLNPPYNDLAPWARKCSESVRENSDGDRILLLVPASVGSNWWRDYVHEKASVAFLNSRIKFVGHTGGYPKDLALCVYGERPGYAVWSWRGAPGGPP